MMTLQRMFTIVLIGAIAALCVLLSPSERLLLQQATKVTRETTSLENDIVGYRWLSNQEVIVLRYDAQIKPYLVRLNLRDGTETKLPGWPNDVVHISSTAKKLQISPDRQWIFSFPRGIDTSMLFGGRLDGTYPFDYLGADSHVGQVFWLSDSVHCLEIKYDLFTGLTCHRFRVAHPEDTDTQIVSLPASIEQYFEFDLVADHRVLGHQWRDDDETTKNITIADIRLRTGASSTRTFSVSRPPNAKILELEFSPQGDRIAWLVKQDTISTPMKSLNGKLDQNKADMHPTIGIWVCRLNGTRMHEIGHLPMIDEAAKDAPDDTNSPNPENVQWLPDGRRLSFVYRGALYTVPAD